MPEDQEGSVWGRAIRNKMDVYEDLAFLVSARGAVEDLTYRGIAEALRQSSWDYIKHLSCAPDESPMDSFMEDAYFWQVIEYDSEVRRYQLGKLGRALINQSFEQRV